MEKRLNICTFNVRNDNLIPETVKEQVKGIYHHLLNDYQIDILCTQEMIESTLQVIKNEFINYHIIGDYRYGKSKIVSKIKTLKKYNESNNIVTNYPVLDEKTLELPWFPRTIKELYKGIFKYKSITPRILTEAVLEIDSELKIQVMNTHLDCHIESIQKLQLKKIVHFIKKTPYPVILTGDFNTDITDPTFLDFMKQLDQIGLKRVPFNQKTFKKAKTELAIDHIFLPKKWEVLEAKVIQEPYLDKYSDHYPIFLKIKVPTFNSPKGVNH